MRLPGNKNIVLIGYRCSGKSSVGKVLAARLERDFFDTDRMIEHHTSSAIEMIIARHGWNRFREIERRIILEVSEKEQSVVAAGGGVVMDPNNVRDLRRKGCMVWLMGDITVLRERMDKDQKSGMARPSLTGDDPVCEIRKVLDTREPFYRQAMDLAVDTSNLSLQEVVDRIISALPRGFLED